MVVGLMTSLSVFAQEIVIPWAGSNWDPSYSTPGANAIADVESPKGQCENRPSSYGKTDWWPYYQWTEATKKCTCIPSPDNCCGIALYTNVPFVGKCIEYGWSEVVNNDGSVTVVSPVNAFPVLLGAMSKILLSVILIVCFWAIVVAGVMISSGNNEKGKSLITHVVIAMALLGASWVILRLINPTFFQ